MSSSDTFYWHDYETSGADPSIDRPWQFAGVRTNTQLEIVGEPLIVYSRPTPDRLPHPAAVRVTGITPQEAERRGLRETEFVAQIEQQLAQPRTCGVGYNSIRFDDEITRFALWRNFRDPYAREWQNHNSRWDLLDVARTYRALSPEGICWPQRPDGHTSFRLEDLTAANDIEHGAAHDALADVLATIALAKRLRQVNGELFETLYEQRQKRAVSQLVDVQEMTPLVHVSGMFGAARHNLALVAPIAWHPTNNSELICADLSAAPAFLDQDVDTVKAALFTPAEQLPEGIFRPPLKTVRINRAPVLLPARWVAGPVAERLGLDGATHRAHLSALRAAREADPKAFVAQIQSIWQGRDLPPREDPDQMLYDGFLSDTDRALCQRVVEAPPETLGEASWPFEDSRLPELLFRYRARNFPDYLNAEDRARWRDHCHQQWHAGAFTLESFHRALAEEQAQPELSGETRHALDELAAWVAALSVAA